MSRTKYQSITLELGESKNKEAVQREIDRFLEALSSYPDRFATDPYLSFEQHLCSIMLGEREQLAQIRTASRV